MIKINDGEFAYLVDYIRQNYGINLSQKRVLLEGRLTGYLLEQGIDSYSHYIKLIREDKTGREIANLLNKVTTNHTYFMREAEHFDFLRNVTLPFMQQTVGDKDLRIWCAASSTGEEPYTLAMILADYFGTSSGWDKTLLASDISTRVLDYANRGEYPAESVETLPAAWRNKYFHRVDANTFSITEYLRSQVVFKRFNLMDPIAAKKPFHIVFCRNVMIYFDAPTKMNLINRIYDAMAPGGYLFIGQTESIARPFSFRYIMPSVYQKPMRSDSQNDK